MPRPVFCLTFLILAIWSGVGLAKVIGTVQDASALHVRGGPGTEHPVLVTLPNGAKVSVLEIHDDWILVETPDGERGYVHKRFLRLEADAVVPEETPVADAADAARADSPSDAGATVLPPLADATASPEPPPPVSLPSVQNVIDATPTPAEQSPGNRLVADGEPVAAVQEQAPVLAPMREWTDLRADVDRLIGLTEEMRREVAGNPTEFAPTLHEIDYGQPPGAAPILAVAGAGALVGFFLGTLYGRRQERSRRSRVRL